MIKKIFSVVYFVFSCLLIIGTFFNYAAPRILGFIAAIGLVIFLLKKEPHLSDRKMTILIIIGVILRVILIFLVYGSPYSDYENFYVSSGNFANNGTISKYIEVFPHLIYYIVCLGSLFKVFGYSYKIVVIFNVVIDILSSIILIKGLKNKFAGVIWLLNPINIMWCSICHPTVITNFFLLISFLVLFKCIGNIHSNNRKSLYIMSIIFSILLAVANLFRPIMIILLIAIFIYLLILKFDRKTFFKYLLVVIIIFGSYFLLNKSILSLTKYYLSDDIADKTVGWNIYVGSNLKSSGTWNEKQQTEFDKMFYSSATANEIQEYFLEKGINQYKSNGIVNNLLLFVKKGIILIKDPDSLTCYVFNKMQKQSLNNYVLFFIKFLAAVSYYVLLLFNVIFAYYRLKKKDGNDYFYILQLFIIGIVCSHLFVEVSPRYCLVLIVPYALLFAMYFKKNKGLDEILSKD